MVIFSFYLLLTTLLSITDLTAFVFLSPSNTANPYLSTSFFFSFVCYRSHAYFPTLYYLFLPFHFLLISFLCKPHAFPFRLRPSFLNFVLPFNRTELYRTQPHNLTSSNLILHINPTPLQDFPFESRWHIFVAHSTRTIPVVSFPTALDPVSHVLCESSCIFVKEFLSLLFLF